MTFTFSHWLNMVNTINFSLDHYSIQLMVLLFFQLNQYPVCLFTIFLIHYVHGYWFYFLTFINVAVNCMGMEVCLCHVGLWFFMYNPRFGVLVIWWFSFQFHWQLYTYFHCYITGIHFHYHCINCFVLKSFITLSSNFFSWKYLFEKKN